MNESEHLTENQLTDYFGSAALDSQAKHRIGRHLLQCDFCLKRLPQPTVEQFWTALMMDENADGVVDETGPLAARPRFSVQKLMQPKIFALSAATLAVVLFFSAFIWLNAVKSSEMEKEVAENFEMKDRQPVFARNGDEKIEKPLAPTTVKGADQNSITSTQIVPKRELTAAEPIKPKQSSKVDYQNDFNTKTSEKLSVDEKMNVSLTRGSKLPKCNNQPAIDLEIERSNEKLVLTWKKVPKAAKYHLYVSDDEEILIDEYETEQETSYALTKSLDPLKTYQWKVVISLENGNTVVSDSRKFTVKDVQQNAKKFHRNKNSDVRCRTNN